MLFCGRGVDGLLPEEGEGVVCDTRGGSHQRGWMMGISSRVGYAVVGLGFISEFAVLPAFAHSKKAQLLAVVSSDASKARRLAAEFGAAHSYTYDEYEACLSQPEIEAVYIATHPGTHAQFAVPAAAAHKHVLCEKPMAATSAQCQQMVEASRSNRVHLMIAYRKYFEPASLALKSLVRSGRLGQLRLLHSAFSLNLSRNAAAWHFDPKLAGGGSLFDLGVYCVNTVRWLTGKEPTEASAYMWATDPALFANVEESIAFRLLFPEDMVFQASTSYSAAMASFLQVHGEKGWALLVPAFTFHEERHLLADVGGERLDKEFPVLDEFALELDGLADCIREHRQPEPDGVQGWRDVVVMEAIYRSARANHPVSINPL